MSKSNKLGLLLGLYAFFCGSIVGSISPKRERDKRDIEGHGKCLLYPVLW